MVETARQDRNRGACASLQDFAHNGGYTIDLSICHAGKQRQRDCTCKIAAGDGELAWLAAIALFPVGHLVQWPVVDRCADAFRGQSSDHVVTAGTRIVADSYRKHVPGMKATERCGGRAVEWQAHHFL